MAVQVDWHPEDIKARVRKTGTTLTALAEANGYHRTAFSIVLRKPYPAIEEIIANHLGVQASKIWPSRYQRKSRDPRSQPRCTLRGVSDPVSVKSA